MENLAELQQFFITGYLQYRPYLIVDCAIFGYHQGELMLLLVKSKVITRWGLPGGFVRKDEGLDQAAARVTAQRTGIKNLFLKQFKTFGEPGRNKSEAFDTEKLAELIGLPVKENSWFLDEQVSVGFYAITDMLTAIPQADPFSSECRWFPVSNLPSLAFDHDEMAKEALSTMRIHLYHFPIGKNLLPNKFTLKEIKTFYEVMSGKTLHISNFTGKLISLGLIEKTNEKRRIGAHRSPTFYQFNETVYEGALNEGMVLV